MPGESTRSRGTAGTFWLVTLEFMGDDPGGDINAPTTVRSLRYASSTTMGSYKPSTDRKIIVGDKEEEVPDGA